MGTENYLVNLWNAEYNKKGIPSSFKEEPSGPVVEFLRLLSGKNIKTGKALDIGCGMGRNSIFLAQQGFEVCSMDFVPESIRTLAHKINLFGLASRVIPICHDIAMPWPFKDETFDIATDTFCYTHDQANLETRSNYKNELRRVLKVGGFYLLTLPGVDDGYYGPLLASSPNPKERVIIDPENDIPMVLYTREDVERNFNNHFSLIYYSNKKKDGLMHGKIYPRSTHIFVFAKK